MQVSLEKVFIGPESWDVMLTWALFAFWRRLGGLGTYVQLVMDIVSSFSQTKTQRNSSSRIRISTKQDE